MNDVMWKVNFKNKGKPLKLKKDAKASGEMTLLSAVEYLLHFVPSWAETVPSGLDPTFYGTMAAEGDLAVKAKVDEIKELVKRQGR